MRKIRFALAQMNPTVGDYPANVRKILAWIREAWQKKADMIVFPEISLSGYPCWDLANKKRYVEEGLRHLEEVVRSTRGKNMAVILGFIDRGRAGHRSRNALAWIERGKIRAIYHKQLLPTYDVFLEDIFFEPGRESIVVPWKKRRMGVTICEDIWDEAYEEKPLKAIHRLRAHCVINISCSPYYRGVAENREHLLRKHTVRYGFPILYVNQVGGQDDLIFDGRSLFVNAEGRVLFRAPGFEEGLFFYDWQEDQEEEAGSLPAFRRSDSPEEMYQALVLGIRDYCRKNRFKKVVIGLSGGIDSALTAVLASDALGPRSVLGVTMPGCYSSRGSWEDSRDLARRLGIEFRIRPIQKKYDMMIRFYREHCKKEGGRCPRPGQVTVAMENLQARLRGLELMYLSNDEGRLLLSTGNKSELAVGYCTLYGDMAGGLSVLGDVYKTDVYRLAMYRNRQGEVIPRAILEKPPSAELRPGQKDQDSLPPYEFLDEILALYIEGNKSRDEICEYFLAKKASQPGKFPESAKVLRRLVADVIRRVDHNEYKRRQTPPILRVTQKAWFGRRMPITNRFDG